MPARDGRGRSGSGTAEDVSIRPIPRADEAQRAFVTGYSFAGDRGERAVREFNRLSSLEWTRGLYQRATLIACLVIEPYTVHLEGSDVPMHGIADVACLPEQRRKGHVTRLLQNVLAEMRDGGIPLSGLYTPHPALYRRFGWGIAVHQLELRFPIKRTALRAGEPPRGHAQRLQPDDWRRLDAVYRASLERRNCGLRRWESRWREHVLGGESSPQDAAVWVDGAGNDQGYAVYRETGWQNHRRGDLRVREVVGLTAAAWRGLTAYLLQHDLSQDAIWPATEEDPLPQIVDDPDMLSVERRPGLLLRVVDLPAALAARPCYAPAGAAVAIELRDTTCDWNEGIWRIANEDGRMQAERSGVEPQVSLDAATLAALYNGGLAPETAALAGLIEVHDPRALATLHDLLTMRHRPACREFF